MIQQNRPNLTKPTQPAGRVPDRVAATVAVMHMGVSDYGEISQAVGLPVDEVERIDMAEDPRVRRLAAEGTPDGAYFHLVRPIRCPTCREKITLVPCVACDSQLA